MSLTEIPEQSELQLGEDQRQWVEASGTAIAAYLRSAKELLAGRLSHLKVWAPTHLVDPGNVLVACCNDGIVVRYEKKGQEPSKVFTGWMSDGLSQVASVVSQKLIDIKTGESTNTSDNYGVEWRVVTTSPTGESSLLATTRMWFEATLPNPLTSQPVLAKPFCLLSIQNSLELQLFGEMIPVESGTRPAQPFLARSVMRLPVGWECIEIFPGFTAGGWKSENAPIWAETDILAGVVSRQFQEAQFNNLDPRGEARKQFVSILESYTQLLQSQPEREEILQSFLAGNPLLLCPAFTRYWPKLAFGSHITDFVFQEASGDYLLVELEKLTDPLFVKTGHASYQLNRARGQVQDWRRYLEDNLSTVQRELGLSGISSNPKCLIVMGRSSELTDEHRRKITAMENESPRLKVITYDDVLVNAKAVVENILGPLWNVQGSTQIYYLPAGTRPENLTRP